MEYGLGYNIYVMQSLTRISGLVLRSNVQKAAFRFSSDSWKDRDEAAEKVYISRKESTWIITQGIPFSACSRRSKRMRQSIFATMPSSRQN